MPALTRPRSALLGAVVAGGLLLTGCTSEPEPSADPTGAVELTADLGDPIGAPVVIGTGDPVLAAVRTSEQLFDAAPVVVVAEPDEGALATAATVAVAAGAPLLVDDGSTGETAAELDRLDASHVLTVGDVGALPEGLAVAAADPDTLAAAGLDLADPTPVTPDGLIAAVGGLDRPGTAVLRLADPDAEAATSGTGDATVEADAAGDEPTATSEAGDATAAGDEPTATAGAGPTADAGDPTTTAAAADPDPLVLPDWIMPTAAPTRPASSAAPAGSPWPDDATIAAPDPAAGETAVLIDPLAGDDPLALVPALATARAAGLPVVEVPGGDPRTTGETVRALAGSTAAIALGDSFGTAEVFAPRFATAATGVELPGGGQLVFPGGDGVTGKKYVALYGTPGTPALGVLGEQDVPASIARAEQTAAPYRALTGDTVVPTLEIIATIASAGPEPDGSYSRGRSVDELRPLIEAAGDAGMAVVIDLQPGRTDFLTQAQRYAELLEYPHVGLALDPEWRLGPDQVHLRQIGSVGVDEVNQVSDWLAGFVRERNLPQKMFLLHQFSLRMITDRDRLNVDHDELATIIHADGQGSQPAKAGTWNTLRQGAPEVHWGWKNFYDEDQPMLTPEQTYQVAPVPDLVTYQ